MKLKHQIPFIGLLALLVAGNGYAQSPDAIEKARADMAVPDAPAFKILDVDESTIMRPGNLREVSVAVSNFLLASSVLPRAYAVEFSPGLLLGNVSLPEYQKNPFWYRLRVSAATAGGSDGSRDIALGLRFTFFDETDLRTDKDLEKLVLNSARAINDIEADALKQLPADYAFLSDSLKKIADRKYDDYKASVENTIAGYEAMIVRARDEAKKIAWNKPICEAGLAVGGHSKDSLSRNLVGTKYAVWLTAGSALFGAHDQTLFGLRALLGRNSEGVLKKGEGSAALRSYYGGNSAKGFLEADWTFSSELAPCYSARLGGELDAANGLWLEASFGVGKSGTADPYVTTAFNIRVATPELR